MNPQQWVQSVLKVLGSQVLLQALGFGISIFLIREMTKEDYAIYTVLFSIQSMLAILSDSGIMIGFNAIGGKVWQKEDDFASLIKTVAYLRIRVVVVAFAVAGIYGLTLLMNQNSSVLMAMLFVACLGLIVVPEVHKSFIQQALLIKKDIGSVQLTSILYQGMRLVLICLALFIMKFGLSIQLILVISILSSWASFLYILEKSKPIRSPSAEVNLEYKSTLLQYLKTNWHNALFFSFQGQISIFLIALLGTTASLAELGALTRFSLLFTALLALVSNIVGPAFGRCQNKGKLVRSYISMLLAILVLATVTLLTVYLFPSLFLWILGEQYQQLSHELFLVFVACSIHLAASTVFCLNSYRGWIRFTPVWEIPANIFSLGLGVLLFDLSTLEGVLTLSIIGASTNLFLYVANSIAGFKQLPEVVELERA
ncbi:lipopolysaccharide biosynthesis protein [Pontibacter roseus]|uniref:lipopolysaccharide biosynthesis protein n=1 Tax=Pontibacter roseus TaxID=336989 RepID=UPI00036FDBC6|nr:hypothetical protein [Pontibacter roseus]